MKFGGVGLMVAIDEFAIFFKNSKIAFTSSSSYLKILSEHVISRGPSYIIE